LTGGQRHTGNIKSGLFGQTDQNSCLHNKNLKHPNRTKKIEFLLLISFGTFTFAANAQAIPEAKSKELNRQRFV